jgi:hypothetical protein
VSNAPTFFYYRLPSIHCVSIITDYIIIVTQAFVIISKPMLITLIEKQFKAVSDNALGYRMNINLAVDKPRMSMNHYN